MFAIGNRKIIAGAIILALGIGSLLLKGDVPPGFLELLKVVFGAFVIGNAAEHISNAVGDALGGPVDTPEEVTQRFDTLAQAALDTQTMLTQLQVSQESTAAAVANTQAALSMIITKYKIAE